MEEAQARPDTAALAPGALAKLREATGGNGTIRQSAANFRATAEAGDNMTVIPFRGGWLADVLDAVADLLAAPEAAVPEMPLPATIRAEARRLLLEDDRARPSASAFPWVVDMRDLLRRVAAPVPEMPECLVYAGGEHQWEPIRGRPNEMRCEGCDKEARVVAVAEATDD